MKLVVIGFGQCGCNIADEFYAVNQYAKSFFNRRLEIVTDAFAVNTDEADLGSFRHIPRDRRHRILIGSVRTFGHGVGKINFDAARIIKESHSVVSDAVLKSKKFYESDAIMVIASGGGGTGSGTVGWALKELKERVDKPVYALIVLPFGFEEKGDTSYALTNTATCLKTVEQYADAVFLLDNERFRELDNSLARNFEKINREMVNNFYDLCCAGEERNPKYVGSKVLDAGDIKKSLEGISTIGRGAIELSTFYRLKKADYRGGVQERGSAVGALHQAINNLSLGIEIQDARNILVLITAPKEVITLTTLEELSTFLQDESQKSVIRIGDYPRRGKQVSVTLVASKLTKAVRLENLYAQAGPLLEKKREIDVEAEQKIKQLHEIGKDLPTLA